MCRCWRNADETSQQQNAYECSSHYHPLLRLEKLQRINHIRHHVVIQSLANPLQRPMQMNACRRTARRACVANQFPRLHLATLDERRRFQVRQPRTPAVAMVNDQVIAVATRVIARFNDCACRWCYDAIRRNGGACRGCIKPLVKLLAGRRKVVVARRVEAAADDVRKVCRVAERAVKTCLPKRAALLLPLRPELP